MGTKVKAAKPRAAKSNPLDSFLAEVDRHRFGLQAALGACAVPFDDKRYWIELRDREQIGRSDAVGKLGDILVAATLDNFTKALRAEALGNRPVQDAIDEVVYALTQCRGIAQSRAPKPTDRHWITWWDNLNGAILNLRSHPITRADVAHDLRTLSKNYKRPKKPTNMHAKEVIEARDDHKFRDAEAPEIADTLFPNLKRDQRRACLKAVNDYDRKMRAHAAHT